uniref:T-cell receptor alpha/delta variable 14.0 n=1 Tax=Sinocyclocheilus anshuiensis TaxID=1608454 RepID=A0A671Q1P3_9TELE
FFPNSCLFTQNILQYIACDILTNMITLHDSQKQVLEGKNVTLTCNYSGAPDNLHWYHQYPRSTPKFLLYIYESGLMSDNIPQRLTPRINKNTKRVDLEISSAAVTDSAVYYCALRPTVTGNKATLYENMKQREMYLMNHQT